MLGFYGLVCVFWGFSLVDLYGMYCVGYFLFRVVVSRFVCVVAYVEGTFFFWLRGVLLRS